MREVRHEQHGNLSINCLSMKSSILPVLPRIKPIAYACPLLQQSNNAAAHNSSRKSENLYDVNVRNCFTFSADKKLFTPGPLLVSRATKEAMLRDLGSRDTEFIGAVEFIRKELVSIAGESLRGRGSDSGV